MTVSDRHAHPLPVTTPLPPAPDAEFDRMAALTRRVLHVPIALVSLVASDCQVVPGLAGNLPDLDATRTNDLSFSLCQYVVRGAEPFVFSDAADVDFLADNRSVVELGVVSYAGMPLFDARGTAFGSLCAMDIVRRDWTDEELETLRDLADAVSAQFRLREIGTRTAVSADRDRIARDLQSAVIGDLFRLSMTLGSVRTMATGSSERALAGAIDTVDTVIARIRDSVFDVD